MVGTLEAIACRIACLSETCLATADIDQQVHVIAGSVALQLLLLEGSRNGSLQDALVVATHRQQICQTAGALGVGFHIGILAILLCSLERGFPVELCHALLVQSVTGIAQPVEGLFSRQHFRLLQTVGQLHQPLIVICLLGTLQKFLCCYALLFLIPVPACHCEQEQEHHHERPKFCLFHIQVSIDRLLSAKIRKYSESTINNS